MGKYKTYEKYKPSGVDWLGEVPQNWKVIKLAFIANKITNGYVGPTRDIFVSDGVIYLQSLHIQNNKIVFDNNYFVTHEWSQKHSKSILAQDDVLIVQTGGIGNVAVVTPEFEGANCHALIIVTPRNEIIVGKYLSWLLNSSYGLHSLKSLQTGALHPHLNCGEIRDIKIPVPSIKEQKQIARFLDRETTRIDTLITKKRQLIALLQKKRFSAITHAVTKGLDHKVDMKDANIFWLEAVPKHWGICQLKFACILQRGFDLPSQERQEGEFPIYGGGGITGYHDQAMVQPPGVVTGRYGTVGEVYFVEEPFWPLNTSLYVKEFWGNSQKFIHYLLSALPIDIYAGKSAVPGVDRNDLHAIPVPIPSKKEQDHIVQYLEKIDAYQRKLTQIIEDQLKEIEKYRSALITSAVTGKIDVREEVN